MTDTATAREKGRGQGCRRPLHLALLLGCLNFGFGAAQTSLQFSELYGRVTVRGVQYSEKLRSLHGQTVTMRGYMAPPLKPDLDFFVLTREPLATCPFCTSAADWPPDIVLVIMPSGRPATATTRPIAVTGRLDLGIKRDEETGFVSLVRIYAQRVQAQ